MEKQYIFFNTSIAFWFCALCGLAMFFIAIFAGVYLELERWQFGILSFIFSGAAILAAYKIDRKKKYNWIEHNGLKSQQQEHTQ